MTSKGPLLKWPSFQVLKMLFDFRVKKNLMLLNVNARSLVNKYVNFSCLVECHNPSVKCVTGTWFNESIPEKEFLLPGYSVIRNDRHSGHDDGFAFFYQKWH